MWRSIFLHEFIDEDIRNYQALPGNPTPNSLMLTPIRNTQLRSNTVQIIPGRGFEHTFTEPFQNDIIGISARIRLRYPIQSVTAPVPLLRVGDMAEFRMQPLPGSPIPPPNVGHLAAPARGLLRIGQTEVELGEMVLPHRRFTNIRFDWHTSGQARLLQNDKLIGYQNAVAPAQKLDVASVALGLSGASPAATNPRYEVSRVFVRVLGRSDSLAALSKLFPEVAIPDDPRVERCHLRATMGMLSMVDQIRQFMALFHQKRSQPWTSASGPSEGPFTPDAKKAHKLANRTIIELAKALRTGNFSNSDDFLESFERFLRILHEALPDEFDALSAKLIKTFDLSEECMQLQSTLRDEHQHAYGPLIKILSEASNRFRDITGGV